MSHPPIPGFYFDEHRGRYFRVVNGDQRLNSAYSNNSLRAKERSTDYHRNKSNKRSKPENALSRLSIDAKKQRFVPGLFNWKLYQALGASSSQGPSLATQLSVSTTVTPLRSNPIWPAFEDDLVFVTDGPVIELHAVEKLLRSKSRELPIVRHPLFPFQYVDPALGTSVTDLENNGKYVYALYGSVFSLSLWHIVKDKYVVEDKTEQLKAALQNYISANDPSNSRPSSINQLFLGSFGNETLLLLASNGDSFIVDLTTLEVVGGKRLKVPNGNPLQRDCTLNVARSIWFYNLDNCLIISDWNSLRAVVWKFNTKIFKYFISHTTVDYDGRRQDFFLQFYIVTQQEIVIRYFSTRKFDKIGSDTSISIHNDNQARPLIHKSGDNLLVEENSSALKIVDLASMTSHTIDIKLPFTSPRDCMPRMLQSKNNFFLVDSNTYTLGKHTRERA